WPLCGSPGRRRLSRRRFLWPPLIRGCHARRGWALRLPSCLQVAELVLADLDLVAVLELVGLDAAAVDVRPVQRAEVVDVEPVLPADEKSVIARDRDVGQEEARVRRPSARDSRFTQAEALPPPAR